MAQEVAHHHPGEHEVSVWPLPVGISILLTPVSITAYFAWDSPMLALVMGGIAVVLGVIGLAGWANEFFTKGHEEGFGNLAIYLFILSEIIIFGTVFAAFWMSRAIHSEVWVSQWIPEAMNLKMPVILTLILWASSFTILKAEGAMHHGNREKAVMFLLATMFLGVLFTVLHVMEWMHLWEVGFTLSSNMYGTGFYTLTGIHTSHVLVGVILQAYVLFFTLAGKITPERITIFRTTGAYWHFVDVMWLLVASTAYLVGGMKI
ncbi:MAG TPA: heme-copper oxidase subunit III [Aquificaceae bacterium]|nr:heme-copper oxidase subunit III [Aquificaceae bacterium]HIQ31007.1 heme-copper oxidase subunit III [Aquifex aeolicus]